MFKLPTDNLYKLVAVFGIIIIINSGYYIYKYYYSLQLLLNESEMIAKENIKLNSPIFLDKLNHLIKRKEATDDKIEREKVEDQIKNLVYESWREKFEVDKKISEIDFKQYDPIGRMFYKGCLISLFLGLCMMVGGFTAWYHKVQKFQDKALRHSVEKDVAKKNRIRKVYSYRKFRKSSSSMADGVGS